MSNSPRLKIGDLVYLTQDHIEDDGLSFKKYESGRIVDYDTDFLVKVRMNSNEYTTCVNVQKVERIK